MPCVERIMTAAPPTEESKPLPWDVNLSFWEGFSAKAHPTKKNPITGEFGIGYFIKMDRKEAWREYGTSSIIAWLPENVIEVMSMKYDMFSKRILTDTGYYFHL